MQTRSKSFDIMNEAANTLLLLSQSKTYHAPPSTNRSVPYHPIAWQRATKIARTTKPGDTILVDFWINYQDGEPGWTIVEYLENKDGKMHHHHAEGPYHTIGIKWTYQATDNPF
jgi:hypothetical protein